jgi:hypothetical protein
LSKTDCISGIIGGAIAWGPWNPLFPIVGGTWTAITSLKNGECPSPDSINNLPFYPAKLNKGNELFVPDYGHNNKLPPQPCPPYMAKVIPYTIPQDCKPGNNFGGFIPNDMYKGQQPEYVSDIQKTLPYPPLKVCEDENAFVAFEGEGIGTGGFLVDSTSNDGNMGDTSSIADVVISSADSNRFMVNVIFASLLVIFEMGLDCFF